MLINTISNFSLILGTQSPRRHFLMKEAGFNFEVIVPKGIEEIYPETIAKTDIPVFLAELKSKWFEGKLSKNQIVITADTIVLLDNMVLGKPKDRNEAFSMIKQLSGRGHDVITGVCFRNYNKTHSFSALSKVYFRELSDQEINYYINNYQPYDKAGSYGAQEWIGYIAIEHIEGSYFNVMGLPIQMLYTELEKFIES